MLKRIVVGILAAACVMLCGCTKTVTAKQTGSGFAYYSQDCIEIIDSNGWYWSCPKCGKHEHCSDGQKYTAKQCGQCGERYEIKFG